MIVDVNGIENYECKPIKGKIGYRVGDSWNSNAKDSYRTMFAYYYHYERDLNNETEDSVTLETLEEEKALGINPAKFSYAEIPLIFSLIVGVTGTLEVQSQEQKRIMKDVYDIKS